MSRGVAILLVLLTSMSLGHVPCCLVPSACASCRALEDVDAGREACCPNCAPDPRPVPSEAGRCRFPAIAGFYEVASAPEFEPAALPAVLHEAPRAPRPAPFVATPMGPRSPPRADLSLPLLL